MMRRGIKCMTAVMLTAFLFAAELSLFPPLLVKAETEKTLTLQVAKKLAVANSTKIEQLDNRLDTKEAQLKQAVKSIQLKKENMASFRWTPLLSFKFPEKPDMPESFEFTYKPLQIQSEIDTIKHEKTDQQLAEYEKVSNLYVNIVVYEQNIEFDEERLAVMESTLAKNKAKLLTGEANESDISSMEKNISSLTAKIANDKRSYLAAKKKLSNIIGLDVTTNYKFENPFVESEIKRSSLSALQTYTLDRDQDYYDASMEATMALTALKTNYSLMKSHYSSSEMSYISTYINQAINGDKLNTRAFKKQYDAFLKKVDEPWTGYKRIWFIKIPKVWFKGSIDGVRFVEDEPYAMYESTLEYQDARLNREAMGEELKATVEDTFNNYVSVRNSYLSYVKQVEDAKQQVKKNLALNNIGKMTYEEYKSSVDEYEDLQNAMFEALSLYTQTLYSFDRLTCGGITELLSGTGADLESAGGGDSYVVEEYAEGAHYYIRPIVQEAAFELGVSFPEDFKITITDYELWCDNIRIGEKTPVSKTIRHLGISKKAISTVKLRFYNGDSFVSDCKIDPDSYSGPLSIVSEYRVVEGETYSLGTYQIVSNSVTGMTEVTMNITADKEIQYYRILTADNKPLSTGSYMEIKKKFQYLPLLSGSMEELVIEFYDKDKELLCKGYFDTFNREIRKEPEKAGAVE